MTPRLFLLAAGAVLSAGSALAADLPMTKAEAIEYVKICDDFGTGFFYIPGTDTCLQVSGLLRAEYQSYDAQTRNGDTTRFNSTARVRFDARSATEYGPLRSFIELNFGIDAGTTSPSLRRGFIQFAGFTAGYAQSTFSFYDQYYANTIFMSYFTEQGRRNLFSYQANFGKAFAIAAIEDGRDHRSATALGGAPGLSYGGQSMPDLVGVLGYDDGKGGWGRLQASAALHQIRANLADYDSDFGYAVGLGGAVNLPFAAGAYVAAEADYADGAVKYLGANRTTIYGNAGAGADAYGTVVAPLELDGAKGWSVAGEAGVNFTPSLIGRVMGSYLDYDAPNFVAATQDFTVWTAGVNLTYTVVKNLTVGGEISYVDRNVAGSTANDYDGWRGGVRIQRSF